MKFVSALMAALAAVTLNAAELTDWKLAGPLPNTTEAEQAAASARAAKFIAGDLGETQNYSTPEFPGKIFFHEIWEGKALDNKMALAATVIKIDKPGLYRMEVAHDCSLDIFLNGKKIYSKDGWRDENTFFADFGKGDNLLVLKNTHSTGWWGIRIYLEAGPFTKAEAENQLAAIDFTREYKDFANLRPFINGNSLITLGEFGKFEWNGMTNLKLDLESTWLDADLQPVKSAEKPGRYFLKLSGTINGRVPYLRYFMFYAVPKNWLESPEMKTHLAIVAQNPWTPWNVYYYPETIGNLFDGKPVEAFDVNEKLLALRADRFIKKLSPPQNIATPATTLRFGTEAEAGVPAGTADRLDTIMKAWYEDTGEPSHTYFAKNGVIFYSKSYGDSAPDRVCHLASISKFITAILYARFIDQGILDLDQPMSNVLPSLPMLTPRLCFTHMCGLDGHYNYGGLGNLWLDEAVAPAIDPANIGITYFYEGDGYNLLALQMMVASGTTIDNLYRESYYEPLGIDDMNGDDQGGGYSACTDDLAKFAQIMLNRGSYGKWKFFGEAAYRKMLPEPLPKYFPHSRDKREWGMGLQYFGPEVDGKQRVLGHGSGTASLCLFNPDAQAFIAQARGRRTVKYSKYADQIFKLLAELK